MREATAHQRIETLDDLEERLASRSRALAADPDLTRSHAPFQGWPIDHAHQRNHQREVV